MGFLFPLESKMVSFLTDAAEQENWKQIERIFQKFILSRVNLSRDEGGSEDGLRGGCIPGLYTLPPCTHLWFRRTSKTEWSKMLEKIREKRQRTNRWKVEMMVKERAAKKKKKPLENAKKADENELQFVWRSRKRHLQFLPFWFSSANRYESTVCYYYQFHITHKDIQKKR